MELKGFVLFESELSCKIRITSKGGVHELEEKCHQLDSPWACDLKGLVGLSREGMDKGISGQLMPPFLGRPFPGPRITPRYAHAAAMHNGCQRRICSFVFPIR
jgi:hypothetical protein